MALQSVVMAIAQVMKPMIIVQTTVYLQGNALLAKLLTVMEQTNAGQNHGLETASLIVMISSMVLT